MAPPSSARVYNVYDGCGCLLLMAHPFRKVTWVLWQAGWTLVRGSLTWKYQEKGFRKSALKRGMGGPSSGVPWYKCFTKNSHFFNSFFTFFSLSFCFVFTLFVLVQSPPPPPPPPTPPLPGISFVQSMGKVNSLSTIVPSPSQWALSSSLRTHGNKSSQHSCVYYTGVN